MNTNTLTPIPLTTSSSASRRFLAAVLDRAFADLTATLDPHVRLRALVPPGPFELVGSAAVTAQFEHWFGGGHDFAVVSYAADLTGRRAHLQWTVHRRDHADDPLLSAEQHCLVSATERVSAIDLMCTGWTAVAA